MIPFQVLISGWSDLLRPKFFGILLRSVGLTILLFVFLQAAIFWIIHTFVSETFTLPLWGEVTLGPILSWGSLVLFPILSFFLMAPVATGFSGLYADHVAAEVEAIHYPASRNVETDFWDGLLESLAVTGAALLASLIILVATPFIGPLAPILFYIVNGWLLGREFFQMIARRHLGEAEATQLRHRYGFTITMLGVMIAFGLTIPFVNIALPVLAATSFTHLYHRLNG